MKRPGTQWLFEPMTSRVQAKCSTTALHPQLALNPRPLVCEACSQPPCHRNMLCLNNRIFCFSPEVRSVRTVPVSDRRPVHLHPVLVRRSPGLLRRIRRGPKALHCRLVVSSSAQSCLSGLGSVQLCSAMPSSTK